MSAVAAGWLQRCIDAVVAWVQRRFPSAPNPLIVAVAGLIAAAYAVESLVYLLVEPWSWARLALIGVMIGVCVATMRWPRTGCWLMVLGNMVGMALPVLVPATGMLCMLVFAYIAIGFLDRREALLMAVAGSTANAAITHRGVIDAVALCVLVMVLSGVGIALRAFQEQAQRLRLAELQAERVRLSARLHDRVCNDLSYVLLYSERDADWQRMANAAQYRDVLQQALDEVRHVIMVLDGAATDDETASAPSAVGDVARLTASVDRQESRLAELGFAGTAQRFVDSAVMLDRDDESLLLDLIRETFTNISKHADPKIPYFFALSMAPGKATISVTDTARAQHASGPGTGLDRMERRVKARHGTFSVTDTPERWSMMLNVPLRCAAERLLPAEEVAQPLRHV